MSLDFDVNNGLLSSRGVSICNTCHFLLAQKVTNPVSLREPNASPRKANPPLAGQRGQPAFFPASASHCALLINNQYLKIT